MKGILLVITGLSSGAGKDAVARAVETKGNFARIITFTTREIRLGEKEGVDYHFVSKEKFSELEKEGFFLETNRLATEAEGNYYGSPKDEVLKSLGQGRDVLLRIDINGAREVKKQFPESVVVFIYATLEEMKGRLMVRGRDDQGEMEKKLNLAEREMTEIKKDFVDYRIHNQDGKLEEVVEEVMRIIEEERREVKNESSGSN